jgi:hypothetical protein
VDVVTVIPAQTMADDRDAKLSVLPMCSLFEASQMIAFEPAIVKPRPRFHDTAEIVSAHQSLIGTAFEADAAHEAQMLAP